MNEASFIECGVVGECPQTWLWAQTGGDGSPKEFFPNNTPARAGVRRLRRHGHGRWAGARAEIGCDERGIYRIRFATTPKGLI